MTSAVNDGGSHEEVSVMTNNNAETNNIKEEIAEVTKEFQRSLSITHDDGLNSRMDDSSQKENEQSANNNEND